MEEKSISKKQQSGSSEFLASSPMETAQSRRVVRQDTSDPRRERQKMGSSAGARTHKVRMQQQESQSSASVPATAASVSSQPTRFGSKNPERSKGGDDKKEQHWTALIKDRNRLNAQKSRKKQQEQLSRLEAENTRLSISNDALRYHNRHLQDAISNIKEQQNAQTSSAPSIHQTASLPSQQTAPSSTLNQQSQPSSLMLASNDTTRIIPQALALTAAAFASKPELAALLRPGAVPSRGNTIVGFASPVTGASTSFVRPPPAAPQFCCNEFRAFCTLDLAIQQIYQGDRHHPLCPNYRKYS